jgi:hypothetical protein
MCRAVTWVRREMWRDGTLDPGSEFEVSITGSALSPGYLSLLYAVSPVPAALVDDGALHEGTHAGITVDRNHRLYRGGHSAYRTSEKANSVVGALRLGPAPWHGIGLVRVVFAPLAHTPGFEEILCEACVVIDATRVRSTAVRGCGARARLR